MGVSTCICIQIVGGFRHKETGRSARSKGGLRGTCSPLPRRGHECPLKKTFFFSCPAEGKEGLVLEDRTLLYTPKQGEGALMPSPKAVGLDGS